MPVGAIIGGVGSIAGGLIAGNAQKKAANKAADTSLQVAAQNNALAKDIYGQNAARLDPYAQRGNVAGNAIMELLGYPSSQPAAMAAPRSNALSALQPRAYNAPAMVEADEPEYRRTNHSSARPGLNPYVPPRPTPAAQPVQRAQPVAQRPAGGSARSAFDTWRDSTAYDFQLEEASKALNQNYSARRSLQSGAAIKALQDRRQNLAQGTLMDYIGLLSNQQGVGLSGASAVAGVGSNYVNSVGANNALAGQTAAQAALAGGAANANMWSGIAGGLGNLAGNAFDSSYGGGPNMNQLNGMINFNNGRLAGGL